MDPSTVNGFLDQFLGVVDAGFGLVEGDVRFVLNALIVVAVTLAGAQWALAQEAALAPFFRKVLFVGLFAFLINNWNFLAGAINESGAMLGLRAGGDRLSLADLHNPGRIAGIGTELFGRTVALGEGLNILTDFVPLVTILMSAMLVMLGFFVLSLQVFVALIAFKLGSLAAFVALPWGVFSGTAWVAERPLGWVAGSAIRLFVLGLIASVAIGFVETLPPDLTLDAGGALNILLFGLTMLTLAWFGPQLASEVVTGQPHLSGADAFRAGQGAVATGVGAGVAARILANGASGGRGFRGAGRSGGLGRGGASSPPIDHGRMQPRPPKISRGGRP